MSRKLIRAFGIVACVAIFGCTSREAVTDPAADNGSAESELGLHKGSVDHVAIVEVTTMMLVGKGVHAVTDFATELDPYNREDPFDILGDEYADHFARNLALFDAYDGFADWTDDQTAAWVGRVASGNYLVVDTSKPCDFANRHSYLEIERATMTGQAHTTCGGRMPNEDAMDVTLNFLIRGPAASVDDEDAIGDGVTRATKLSVDEFPYLAELN